MARNGTGVMSTPNTFVPNTTISSDAMNENFSDFADEITNSLPRDGQAGMESGAQIKADDGTAGAPAVTFGSDLDTGAYRPAANEYAIATGGTKRVGVTDKGVLQSSPALAIMMPVGAVFDYAGANPPEYAVFCYGQAISRTTYAALFAVIGTTYGAGDGSTTFNVPDLRGRVVAGQDDMGGTSANRLTGQSGGLDGDTLGATGGAETHTLTTAQIPSHSHGVTDPGHTHTASTTAAAQGATPTSDGFNNGDFTAGAVTVNSNTTGISIQNAGGGGAHNNVQPTIILNKCIVTGVAN